MSNLLKMELTPLGEVCDSTAARAAIQETLCVLERETSKELARALSNRINRICGEWDISPNAVFDMDVELQGLFDPTRN